MIDIGCRMHIMRRKAGSERHYYDVGLQEFEELLKDADAIHVISLGKWGVYAPTFHNELDAIRALKEREGARIVIYQEEILNDSG